MFERKLVFLIGYVYTDFTSTFYLNSQIVIKNQRKAIVSSIAEIMVAKDFFSVCVRIWDFYCVSEGENETAVNNSDVYFTVRYILISSLQVTLSLVLQMRQFCH